MAAPSEDLIVRVLQCHYCKKYISVTTVPEFIGFCNFDCAENWKIEIPLTMKTKI